MNDIKLFESRIIELEYLIEKYDTAYRAGDALISDPEFEELVEELESIKPDSPVLKKIAHINKDDERMQKLPIIMSSMNKIKTIEEYFKWLKSKNIPNDTIMVCTPKYDAAAFCVDESNFDAWTRGNGIEGQYSPEHYQAIMNRKPGTTNPYNFYSYGEVIMPVKTFVDGKFLKDDGTPFSNPRNLVAGKLNDKKANDLLKHCYYIRYGLVSDNITLNKIEQLELLNTLNAVPVQYKTIKASEVTEKYLQDLFKEWKGDFEIDGIIIEVNDFNLREKLGRETGGKKNPAYARAFKGEGFEDEADTAVLSVNCEVSKQGFLKPTIAIVPVILNGALVSNPTGNNYKFIVENQIGPGAIVKVIRSGMVIPKIIKVIKPGKVVLPTHCPVCKSPVEWNDSKVELVCNNDDCEAQRLKKIIAFFEILGVDNMGEGVCEQLYEAGYDTIEKILKMSKDDMKELDRFGERKSDIIYNNIQKAITGVPLAKIQHASGFFKSLGSKKLELLTWANENTTISEIEKIDGFSETLAVNYLAGIKKYNKFVSTLPVTVITESTKVEVTNEKCKGWSVVFSGVRDKNVEEIIQQGGGEISSGISKKTTHLVMKEKGTGSSKEQKAESLNVPIYELEEFKLLIK